MYRFVPTPGHPWYDYSFPNRSVLGVDWYSAFPDRVTLYGVTRRPLHVNSPDFVALVRNTNTDPVAGGAILDWLLEFGPPEVSKWLEERLSGVGTR